eukprot:168546-Chlamydomonas_euryale.AAC.2
MKLACHGTACACERAGTPAGVSAERSPGPWARPSSALGGVGAPPAVSHQLDMEMRPGLPNWPPGASNRSNPSAQLPSSPGSTEAH